MFRHPLFPLAQRARTAFSSLTVFWHWPPLRSISVAAQSPRGAQRRRRFRVSNFPLQLTTIRRRVRVAIAGADCRGACRRWSVGVGGRRTSAGVGTRHVGGWASVSLAVNRQRPASDIFTACEREKSVTTDCKAECHTSYTDACCDSEYFSCFGLSDGLRQTTTASASEVTKSF